MAFIVRWFKKTFFGESDSEESNESTVPDAVLTWNLKEISTNHTVQFQFSADEFEEFRDCLCERYTRSYNGECNDISHTENVDIYSDKYQCYLDSSKDYSIVCRRLFENETRMSGCRTYNRLRSQKSCHLNDIKITWGQNFQLQDVSSDENVVQVNVCTPEDVSTTLLNLESTATTPTETSPALEVTHQYSHPTTIEDRNETLATITPTVSSNDSFREFIYSDDMQGREDNTFVIIGVVLGLCVAVAALVVLGVILWKRKKRALTAGQDVQKRPEEYEMDRSDNLGGNGSGSVENQALEYSYADVNMETVPCDDSNSAHQNSKMANEEHYAIVDSEDNQASGDRKVSDVSSPNGLYTYVDNEADVTLQKTDGRAFHPHDGDDNGSYSVVSVSHNNASRGAYPGNNSLTQNPRNEVRDADVKSNDHTESISKCASKEDEYSRLHQVQREITNPYNLLPETDPKNEYSRLHETQRHFQDPYNFLPGPKTPNQLHVNSTSSNLDIVSETPTYSSVLPKSERC